MVGGFAGRDQQQVRRQARHAASLQPQRTAATLDDVQSHQTADRNRHRVLRFHVSWPKIIDKISQKKTDIVVRFLVLTGQFSVPVMVWTILMLVSKIFRHFFLGSFVNVLFHEWRIRSLHISNAARHPLKQMATNASLRHLNRSQNKFLVKNFSRRGKYQSSKSDESDWCEFYCIDYCNWVVSLQMVQWFYVQRNLSFEDI